MSCYASRGTSGCARPADEALDLGCGAARNAIPLARAGWDVMGLDLSWPMLTAAAPRAHEEGIANRLRLVLAPMDEIPARDRSFDLVIAHGIWNLARSAAEFQRALRETARVARPGAGLFVFTQFSGQLQCFLTESQLVSELAAVGFAADPAVPVTEYNRPRPGTLPTGTVPVIYEAAFRHTG